MSKYYLGIDLGGTNISAGVVDEDYNIISKASTKTNCPEIAEDMAKVSLSVVEKAGLTIDQIEWIGVGSPGIANSDTGVVEYSCNLGFENTPLAKYIQDLTGKQVFIENDANAAAYGEFVAGAAKEIAEDMAKVSLSVVEKAGLTIDQIEWIGVGSPGTVNSETGIIEYSNNLEFENAPMVKYIQEIIDKPIHIENDANAAAYGEFVAGAAKGANSAVAITLGTGVGGGIIIDGKIYSGFNFAGAEIGHSVIDINGPLCTCGRKGCFEVFSSATGLIRMTKEAMELNKDSIMWEMSKADEGRVTARLAFDAMRAGDKTAENVVDKFIKYLACGITNVINIFQPEVVCIGGGVCNEGDALLLPVKELVAKEVYTRNSKNNSQILIAKLGNDAGIIGAAFLGKAK